MQETPFIDIWPDLVKPFLKAKSITRYVIYDCGTTTLDARGGVGRRSQVGGAGWREGGVDVKPFTRIVIVKLGHVHLCSCWRNCALQPGKHKQ